MIRYRESALREMGLAPIWRLRAAADLAPAEAEPEEAGALLGEQMPPQPAPMAATARPAESGRWSANVLPAPAPAVTDRPHVAAADAGREARIAALDWTDLEADIRRCTACRLCERRKQAVPGVGDRQAEWLFVGEGPGAEEDALGEPFVGAAGKLLDNMLAALGLKRGEGVYIANAVKCRPPHNRTPEGDEVAACLPYLERQVALIRPKLIVALGRPAAQALLESEIRIAAARGKAFQYWGTPVVVTYHPAYLLRNQHDKAKAWEDLCFARRLMAGIRQDG